MFLKSVELFGFKSFADRTRFEFNDGVTCLLGPNGSGKSNVVDAIKWVLGSQSLSAIRAGKREDVIFNGTDTRKPMPMCEVILTLDNSEDLLAIDSAEVEIKSRMYRNGETEYYINRARALLKDIKELFMDTGVGKAAYSILEQGKIDQILSVKPEDRRYVFEEAAGISRFKQQSEEASRKLQKTDENIQTAELLFSQIEKTYNSTKVQMDKVLKHREFSSRIQELEVELQLSYIQAIGKFKDQTAEELRNLEAEAAELDSYLDSQRSGMEGLNSELDELKSRRENINNRYERLDEQKRSIEREIELYNERYQDIHQRTRQAQFKARQVKDRYETEKQILEERKTELEGIASRLADVKTGISKAVAELDKLNTDKTAYETKRQNLEAERQNLVERRGETVRKISELAGRIADSLSQSIKGSGYSSAARSKSEKALIERLSKFSRLVQDRSEFLRGLVRVDFEDSVYLSAIQEVEELLLSELDEVKGMFQEYSGSIPTFLDEFLSPSGILSEKEELDKVLEEIDRLENKNREEDASLFAEISRLSRLTIQYEEDLDDFRIQETQYSTQYSSLNSRIAELKDQLQQREFDFSDASHSIEEEMNKENETLEHIDASKAKKVEIENLKMQLKDEIAEINALIDNKTGEISKNNSLFQDKFNRRQELISLVATKHANVENLEAQIQKIYTDFFNETGKSLREFNTHEITAPVDQLKTELDSYKKKRDSLGYINYMAEEEFAEASRNYEFYRKNLDDLIKAKQDLEEIIADIKEKSSALFLETYNQISEAFSQMFTTLFSGGRAELSLSDEENVLESGIEILAQPPGKKLTHLPLLSGGEKSMTAVALLFATYKVKPSPFCILDEIDAALDARNIGAFMKVLENFDDRSQFIIITHNKYTVLSSDSLIGVTQEEAGVSKMVSYRIDQNQSAGDGEQVLKN